MVKGNQRWIEGANSYPVSLATHQLQFQWDDQDALIVVRFGLAHQHTITHARKPKGARRMNTQARICFKAEAA